MLQESRILQQKAAFFFLSGSWSGWEAAGMFQISRFLILLPIKIGDEPCLLQEIITFLCYMLTELRLRCCLMKLTS